MYPFPDFFCDIYFAFAMIPILANGHFRVNNFPILKRVTLQYFFNNILPRFCSKPFVLWRSKTYLIVSHPDLLREDVLHGFTKDVFGYPIANRPVISTR